MTSAGEVTVIIAAYNAETFIGAAITSALGQDPAPAEVIVVDDHSGDGTAAAAEAAGARVIRQPTNQGPGPARAAGVAAASTPWIAWLDADDSYLPGHLARLLRASPGHVLVADAGAGSRSGRWYGWPGRHPLELRRPSQLVPDNPIVTSASMASRTALMRLGGFAAGRHSEDLKTWLLLLEAGTGVVVPEQGVIYGEHPHQATATPGMVGSGEAVFAEFSDRGWYSARKLAALRVVTAWDTDRMSVRRHPAAWPALFRFLLLRRRRAARRSAAPTS